ncbi:MAG: hypothetical protein KDE68_03280 [Rhodocyclaceae bacterium]|nr:hypothetical protein [Rhodocyclaceae bacterium]
MKEKLNLINEICTTTVRHGVPSSGREYRYRIERKGFVANSRGIPQGWTRGMPAEGKARLGCKMRRKNHPRRRAPVPGESTAWFLT